MENNKKESGANSKQRLGRLLETEKEKTAYALAQIQDATKQRIRLFGELKVTEYAERSAIDQALRENKEKLDEALETLEKLNTELPDKLKSLKLEG